jgi:folate-dependent phosphoribosylglycinamide formyltransferase PurN
MRFEVTEYKENEDGSADIQVECDAELMKLVAQEGFMAILNKALESYRESKLG